MKKILLALSLVLVTTLAYPQASFGLTGSDEEALRLEALRQQIKELQVRLAELTEKIKIIPRPLCLDIREDLSEKSNVNPSAVNAVTGLQRYLRNQGFLTVEPTGWYGPLTNAAVSQFQLRQELMVTGMVGAQTREKIKMLTCTTDPEAPVPLPQPIKSGPAPLPPVPQPVDPNPVACTMDAMMCPDGSYVGRVAPTCEFAACPTGPSTEAVSEVRELEVSNNKPAPFPAGYSASSTWIMPVFLSASLRMVNQLSLTGTNFDYLRWVEYDASTKNGNLTGSITTPTSPHFSTSTATFELPQELVGSGIKTLKVRPVNLANTGGAWIVVNLSSRR